MMKYYITAVRYTSDNSKISEVLIHRAGIARGRLQKGKIMTKSKVATLIESGNSVQTSIHNYTTGKWNVGAEINVARNGFTVYIRTNPDATLRDNLGNLLLIDELM